MRSAHFSFILFSGNEVVVASVPEAHVVAVLSTNWQLVFGTILPFLIIISCNVAIIVTLKRASSERSKLEARAREKNTTEKDTQFLTRMLVLVSIAYVVLSIPYRFYTVVMEIPALKDMYDMREPYWNIKYNMQHYILTIFWSCNNAVNCYLYCLGGGKQYRQDTLHILKVIVCCGTKGK